MKKASRLTGTLCPETAFLLAVYLQNPPGQPPPRTRTLTPPRWRTLTRTRERPPPDRTLTATRPRPPHPPPRQPASASMAKPASNAMETRLIRNIVILLLDH